MGIAIAMDVDKYGYYGGEREGLASYDHFFIYIIIEETIQKYELNWMSSRYSKPVSGNYAIY